MPKINIIEILLETLMIDMLEKNKLSIIELDILLKSKTVTISDLGGHNNIQRRQLGVYDLEFIPRVGEYIILNDPDTDEKQVPFGVSTVHYNICEDESTIVVIYVHKAIESGASFINDAYGVSTCEKL